MEFFSDLLYMPLIYKKKISPVPSSSFVFLPSWSVHCCHGNCLRWAVNGQLCFHWSVAIEMAFNNSGVFHGPLLFHWLFGSALNSMVLRACYMHYLANTLYIGCQGNFELPWLCWCSKRKSFIECHPFLRPKSRRRPLCAKLALKWTYRI